MFFSGGKDSIVGLDLLNRAGVLEYVDIFYPKSGFDFKEVENIINYYSNHYRKNIEPFNNSMQLSYSTNTPFEMMSAKAESNNLLIKAVSADIVCV
jgi:3'-phosphoadenosine 5'-phosphosulfate sulfotransferase (PAPS reductase)/FAD synthetase